MQLYPLKFTPIFKDKIWGGNKIKSLLKKDIGSLSNCGESWEISSVPGNISVVRDGPLTGKTLNELIEIYKENLLGLHVYKKFNNSFPLLIKFIDAMDDLSVQVHPNDELASIRHHSPGKTEMWYIIKAEKDATLISGFNRALDKKEYINNLKEGNLLKILNVEKAGDDDVFYIPAGRVHTIGRGLLLAEIQQTSDVTYRIFDFDRIDNSGNKRELHTDLSVDAIDYTHYDSIRTEYNKFEMNQVQNLVESKYFNTNRLLYDHSFKRNYHVHDSFGVLLCIEGKGIIQYDKGEINISKGEVVLIPESLGEISIRVINKIKLLETYIP